MAITDEQYIAYWSPDDHAYLATSSQHAGVTGKGLTSLQALVALGRAIEQARWMERMDELSRAIVQALNDFDAKRAKVEEAKHE